MDKVIETRKKIFVEGPTVNFDLIFKNYLSACTEKDTESEQTGALFLAVYRGKVSIIIQF